MEHDMYQALDTLNQKIDLLIEKVYAKEISEQKKKENEAKNNQKLKVTPLESLDEGNENKEDDGYDPDGTPSLKINPDEWKPEPYDDGIVDEEEEAQEFEKFKQEADAENEKKKQANKKDVLEAKIIPPKPRKNIFVTED